LGYRILRGTPEHIDTRHMDDSLKRQRTGRAYPVLTQRDGTALCNLFERVCSALTFNSPRYALRQKQPSGNDIPIPAIYDHLNILIKNIAINDFRFHRFAQLSPSQAS